MLLAKYQFGLGN